MAQFFEDDLETRMRAMQPTKEMPRYFLGEHQAPTAASKALFDAAARGDAAECAKQLARGGNPNWMNHAERGFSPVHTLGVWTFSPRTKSAKSPRWRPCLCLPPLPRLR